MAQFSAGYPCPLPLPSISRPGIPTVGELVQLNLKLASLQFNSCSEVAALSVEHFVELEGISRRSPPQAEPENLKRNHPEPGQATSSGVERREVHECEVVAVAFISLYALVIVKEVARSVHGELASVNLQRTHMMGRMTVHHIDRSQVDQHVSEPNLFLGDGVSPIAAPVDGENHEVFGTALNLYRIDDFRGSLC